MFLGIGINNISDNVDSGSERSRAAKAASYPAGPHSSTAGSVIESKEVCNGRKCQVRAKEAAASRRKRIKQSGVTGVTHVVSKSAAGKVYAYWQAAWTEGQTRKTAKFSVARNGDKKALDLAIKAKRKAKRNS